MTKIFTAQQILQIEKVGDLFSNDLTIMKNEYRKLSKIYHPDHNKNSIESNEVMAKINFLYSRAIDLVKNNKWESSNSITLLCKDSSNKNIKFISFHSFELGSLYIDSDKITYIIDKEYKDFYENGLKIINGFKYADSNMKEEFSKYLPTILEKCETKDNQLGVVFKKTPDLLLLQDVLDYYRGIIPDKHSAWILSSLYNLACYIDYCNLTHNAILPINYFISPKYHSGALLGGWWYAGKQNEKILGVPNEIYDILPIKTKEDKKNNITTDLESIRLLGKKILGENNGCNIKYNKDLPQAFINWLLMGSVNEAKEEYKKWNQVLNNSYGKRRFVDMNLSEDNLYKNNKKKEGNKNG